MADNEELLRLKLDTGDAAQKLRELSDLQKQITEGKAAGRDVGGLEQQLGRETEQLAQMTNETKRADAAGGDLLRGKRALTAVVRTLGGDFAGLAGDLGRVTEELLTGGKAAGAMALGVAAITATVTIWKEYTRTVEAALAAREKLMALDREAKSKGLTAQTRIADQLAGAGVFGQAGTTTGRAAYLQSQGNIEAGLAEFGAVGQVLGGLSDEQTRALIAGHLATGQGERFGTDQTKNQAVIAKLLQAGATPGAQRALQGRIEDVRSATLRNLPPVQGVDTGRAGEMEDVLAQMRAAENLSDVDVERIRRYANLVDMGQEPGRAFDRVFKDDIGWWRGQLGYSLGSAFSPNTITPEGATRTAGSLRGLGERALGSLRDQTGQQRGRSVPYGNFRLYRSEPGERSNEVIDVPERGNGRGPTSDTGEALGRRVSINIGTFYGRPDPLMRIGHPIYGVTGALDGNKLMA